MADTNLRIKIGMQGAADVNAGLRAIGSAASSLKATLAGIAASVGGLVSLGAAIQQSVKFNAELEQQAVAFKTLLGNAEAASRRMTELAKFAAQTPFELPEIVQASKVLQSLTNGALASGDGLRLVGDAAAATGRPLEEVAMWVGRLYAGLQSGTPVGEAALRLIEMGLISGTTARKLNDLAESGQGAGEAMTILRDTFGRLGGAMADQSQTFSGLLSTLKDTFNMALADIGKPLFDALKIGIAALIPVIEDVGSKISAWVTLAIRSWQDGRFSEIIGLTIEAGVEIGTEAFKELSSKVVDFFTDQRVANAIGNATMTLVAGTANAFIELNAFFQSYWNSVGVYAAQAIGAAIRASINAVLASVSVATLGRVNLPLVQQTAVNFDDALAAGSAIARANAEKQKELVDALLSSYRDFIAAEGESNTESEKQVSAKARLLQLLKEIEDSTKRTKEVAKGAAGPAPVEEAKAANMKAITAAVELQMTERIAQINAQRAVSEGSWLTTSAQKFRERKQLLEAEYKVIVDQIRAYEQMRELAVTAEERQQIEGRISALGAQGVGVMTQRQSMGPDPQSFGQNFQATVVQLQNQFGTVAQQMASTFADVFNSAISSISNGITGLILGTMSWGQALAMIGTTILTTIVQSIVQMGVRWVATQILMATVGKSIMAASLAATVPIAAASSAVWATPATLATIASYGAAAAAAPGFILGAQGMVLAQSLAAFREGGYTGDGNPNDVAGIVHRGEFVVPADAVDRIGLSTLQAMTAAGSSDPGAFTSSAAPGPITLNMGVFDNPARLNDWARSNEGRTVLVDIMRQHAHEFTRS
jgi:hypothetical protein